jgi:hypothetical protein
MTTTSRANDIIALTGSSEARAHVAEALVIAIEDERVRVRLAGAPGETVEVKARVAVLHYAPSEGDRVLVTREGNAAYVTGVLRTAASPKRAIETPSGASAAADGDVIAVRDARGRLVVSFDAATGELRLASDGDLKLEAPEGRVVIESGESKVTVAREGISIAAGSYELRAGRLVERATDAFRTVEEIFETRAKYARTIAERTLELLGRRTTIASEEDTRVEGKRVLLG